MYPATELNALATRKDTLRRRITARRADTVAAVNVLLRPMNWLDRAIALGAQLAPLARVALGPLGLAWAWWRSRRQATASRGGWLQLLLTGLQLWGRRSGRRPVEPPVPGAP
jgi:hypothetical protein